VLTNLIAEGYALLGLTEAKKKAKKKAKRQVLGASDTTNPKRKALIKKLKKMPHVRDPEALASWIGRRVGGQRSHG